MKRVVVAVLSIALPILACFGRVRRLWEPQGTLDDNGIYRVDGSVIFSPGSGCADWDAAIYGDAWTFPKTVARNCDAASDCMDILPKGFFYPDNLHSIARASCVNGTACAVGVGSYLRCMPGDDGDAFCKAFFQQFITAPGAKAEVDCRKCDDDMLCAVDDDWICVTSTACCASVPGTVTGRYELCVVRRDGSEHCELPCQP